MPLTSATGKRRCANNQGFTLLELLVVVAILVLVTALFPFALERALPGRRVAAAGQRVISLVHDSQISSRLSGRAVALKLRSHELTAVVADREPASVSFPASMAVHLSDPEGRALSELLVYPDGSSGGARFELDDSGHHAAILVSGLTGRIFPTAAQ